MSLNDPQASNADNRENLEQSLQPNIALKDELAASGQQRNVRKQALGELQNVFHNHEAQISNKINKIQEAPINEQDNEIEHGIGCATFPDYEFKSTEACWAEKIAFTVEECDRLLAPLLYERREPITAAEMREIIDRDREEFGGDSDSDMVLPFVKEWEGVDSDEFVMPDINSIPVPQIEIFRLEE